MKQIISLCI